MYTVTDWMKDWLSLKSLEVKPRTLESYRDLTERYVVPALGKYDVSSLSPLAINGLLASIIAEGHGRTAEAVYTLLRSALADVEPASPMRRVRRPRHVQKTPEPWSDDQLRLYLSALADHPHKLALMLGAMMGLRRGEICGLRWSDVDLSEGLLHVVNQRQPVKGSGVVDCPPKSASSVRLLPIPEPLLLLMRASAQPEGYICKLTPSGLDTAHRTLTRSLALPYIPLHGLRHSFATAVIRHGGDMRSLQSILGHSSYATTANRYTHPDVLMLSSALDTFTDYVLHYSCPVFALTLNQGAQGSSP